MTVNVDANTKLVLRETKGKVSVFDEVYHGWKTGVSITAPAGAAASEIVELYQK